jgi:hypothetical protein
VGEKEGRQMKRFIALTAVLGLCAAYGLGCTKMAPKEEQKTEAPAAGEMTPPPPPAPATPAEPAEKAE